MKHLPLALESETMFANILQPFITLLEQILLLFHDHAHFGWGLSIIALTVVVRLALVPVAIKQMRSMQTMLKHQPKLKEIQAKYKGDRERLNTETMKFYKENKVNPLGSIFPILVQIPVFISLYYLLRNDLGTHADGAGFLFIGDLTAKATGLTLLALIGAYVGFQLLSTLVSSKSSTKQMRMVALVLPFLFIIFVIKMPAGLLLYMIVSAIWTLGQQMVLKRGGVQVAKPLQA